MALNDTAKNAMLDALGALITYFSLHTDTVGSGTGNEVTGGSPAYARKAATWAAASSGSMAKDSTNVFDIPASTTVRRLGLFGHASASSPYYGDAELTDEAFAGQGTCTLTAATISLT